MSLSEALNRLRNAVDHQDQANAMPSPPATAGMLRAANQEVDDAARAVLAAPAAARSTGGEGCENCGGERWVCENHGKQAWSDDGCTCGAGKPCATCNPSGWLDGARELQKASDEIAAVRQAWNSKELREALAGRNHHRRKAGAAKIARNRALAGLAYWKAKALSNSIAPEGWVLVPRQPTTVMKAATGAWGFDCAHDVWDRMVRAAPAPPAEGGPTGAQRSELTRLAQDEPISTPPPPTDGEVK